MAESEERKPRNTLFGRPLGNLVEGIRKTAEGAANSVGRTFNDVAGTATKAISDAAGGIGKLSGDVAKAATDAANSSWAALVNALDENENGQVEVEDIIIKALRIAGVRVRRRDFLYHELIEEQQYVKTEVAIASNPVQAGISRESIDCIADKIIATERNSASRISALLGAPGRYAVLATIPADIIQYYGYMLRAAQQLMYLYGFPDFDSQEQVARMDAGTMSVVILCLGAMHGLSAASQALTLIAAALSVDSNKEQVRVALTEGSVYRMAKDVSTTCGSIMLKDASSGLLAKAIPVVGGVLGRNNPLDMFTERCVRLKTVLRDTMLSNPSRQPSPDEEGIRQSGQLIINLT